MSAISEIKQKLKKYPKLKVELSPNVLTVFPEDSDGFEVSINERVDEYIISYGNGWHKHFKTKEEALKCFSFGLSTDCRLVVIYRGSSPHVWSVQYLEGGKWLEDSSTGKLLFPFWKPKTKRVYQNKIIN